MKNQNPKRQNIEHGLIIPGTMGQFHKNGREGIVNPLKEALLEHQETIVKQRRNLAYPVYFVIAVIFVGVMILASQGFIDGQSVTFFAGTMVGYLLSYLGEYIGTIVQE